MQYVQEQIDKVKPLSRGGWIVNAVLNLFIVVLAGISLGVAWWVINVWNSDDTSLNPLANCDQYVSLMMRYGSCIESSAGKTSTGDCVKFTDTNYWQDLDNTFSKSSSYNDADFETGAHRFVDALGLISTAITFAIINFLVNILPLTSFIPKQKHNTIQFASTILIGLIAIFLLCGFAIAGRNSMTDADYWQVLLCPAPVPFTSYANSSFSVPYAGYALCVISFVLSLISLSLVLYPGTCCFLDCACCGFTSTETEGNELLTDRN